MLINDKIFTQRDKVFPLCIGELSLDRTHLYISQGMGKSVFEEKGYILSFFPKGRDMFHPKCIRSILLRREDALMSWLVSMLHSEDR